MGFSRALEIVADRREIHRQHLDLLRLGGAAGVSAPDLGLEYVRQANADLVLRERPKELLAAAIGGLQEFIAQMARGRVRVCDRWRDRMPEPRNRAKTREERKEGRRRADAEG